MVYNYKAKVLKVVDGDTIDALVDAGFNIWVKLRLRLYGINTPETRTRDLEEKRRGLAAKKFVKDRIDGKEIQIDTKKGVGKFGRYLAVVYYEHVVWETEEGREIEMKNLNEELIEKGLAVRYFGGKRE